MSDVLEIQGHCDSELDESDNVTQALKQTAKRRKGRGFMSCDSTLESIGAFERLHQQDVARKQYPFQPQHSVEGWVIFITGLHEEATEEDIRQLFSDYGRISNISLNLDRRTGYLKGYALIEYQSFDEAAKAVEYLDEKDLLGHTIRVNWCFTKGPNVMKRKHYK